MTTITTSNGQFMFVPIPEGAYDIVYYPGQTPFIDYFKFQTTATGEIELLPGNYQLLCTTDTITEEIAAGIVDSSRWHFPVNHTRYVDYAHDYDSEHKQAWSVGFGSSMPSFNSLLQKYSITGRQAMLKVI